MNGDKIFIDTNIVLYVLGGDKYLKDSINNKMIFISFITEIELLSFTKLNLEQEEKIKQLIKLFFVVPYQETFKDTKINLRKAHKLKIPDAIIAASSLEYQLPLFTADKNFSKVNDLNVYLYKK